MKKRFLLLLLTVLLLIPFSASAATYKYSYVTPAKLRSWGLQWPSSNSDFFYVNSNQKHQTNTNFFFHQVDNVISLCAGIGKEISFNQNTTVSVQSNFDQLKNNQNVVLNETQRELLKTLIANGGIPSTGTVEGIVQEPDTAIRMIALQIIAWEIIEGGRTSFISTGTDKYAPTYNASNSAYAKLILPNNGATTTTRNSLYYYYTSILETCDKAMTKQDAPAFNTSTYILAWDSAKNEYSKTISGLGPYKSCVTESSAVRIENLSNSSIKVSSTSPTLNATINCKYTTGNGTLNEPDKFYYYAFSSNENYCQTGVNCKCGETNCQKILGGRGIRTYSASFKVVAESVKVKIKKQNGTNEDLDGASFSLTYENMDNYKVTLVGNGPEKEINKNGRYIVHEELVPNGYEAIGDFYITINPSTKKITDCDNKSVTNNVVKSCKNGAVVVSYESETIVLTIKNIGQNIKIRKINSNGQEIKGAVFKIKDSEGNFVKFKNESTNLYSYVTEGSEELVNTSYGIYVISALPSGTYELIEKSVPLPYILPSKEENRITKFKLDNKGNVSVYNDNNKEYEPVVDATISVKNFETDVTIIKDGDGKFLQGVKFELYKADKTTLIASEDKGNGLYVYSENQSTDHSTEYVTNSKGEITIKNLPVGVYYLFETETIAPYTIPTGDDAYKKIEIDVTKNGSTVNGSLKHELAISNSKLTFNFYKKDENGKFLANGEFKIQKYDPKESKYKDIKVKKVTNDGKYNELADVFVPSDDGSIKFTVTNGIATFIEMEASSQYRVVERKAPSGYTLASISESPVVIIDEHGNSSGLLTLVNRKAASNTELAQAELIINISTGVDRVRYALIIGGVVVLVIILIFASKKIDKKNKK